MSVSDSFGPARPKTSRSPTRLSRSLTETIIGWRPPAARDLRSVSYCHSVDTRERRRETPAGGKGREIPRFRFAKDLARGLHLNRPGQYASQTPDQRPGGRERPHDLCRGRRRGPDEARRPDAEPVERVRPTFPRQSEGGGRALSGTDPHGGDDRAAAQPRADRREAA